MAKAKESIGLDIGTSAVRAAHISFSRHPYTLEKIGQVALPPGASRDGDILEPATITAAIKELWKRVGFKRKVVSLGIANQRVVGRPTDVPFMEESELRGSLQFLVQDLIPFPVEDAVVDFQIIGEHVSPNNERMLRLYLVAAQRDMVNSYIEVAERAGLDLEAIDFVPLALIRSLGESTDSLSQPVGSGEAIIDVGAGVTNVIIHENGVPRFARILPVGGNSLTEALAVGLGVPFEDAENIKQNMGLVDPALQAAAPGGEVAAQILNQRAATFVDEIRGSVEYYKAQPDATRLNRVLITGGSAKLANLAARLQESLRLPVEYGRSFSKLRIGTKTGLQEGDLAAAEPLMAAAIGVALGAA